MTTVTVLERLILLTRSATVSGFVLVLSNLIPLAGVLWWGWDAYVVVFIYWLENGIIGLVNVLKIRREEQARPGSGRYLSNFFVLHYGIFWMLHGMLIVLLTGLPGSDFSLPRISPLGLALALAALAASHVGNYLFVFLPEREYLRTDPMGQMFRPYPRLITLHVVLILGAILAGSLGQPVILVILLVLFKIAFELGSFAFHRGVRSAAAHSSPSRSARSR
jgi:hypothetical protein